MDVEELRTQRGLRLVTEAEEGAPLDGLPNGVYGFTYSLGLGSTPLFGKHTFQAFELHKLHDGSVGVAGYVDEPAPPPWPAATLALNSSSIPRLMAKPRSSQPCRCATWSSPPKAFPAATETTSACASPRAPTARRKPRALENGPVVTIKPWCAQRPYLSVRRSAALGDQPAAGPVGNHRTRRRRLPVPSYHQPPPPIPRADPVRHDRLLYQR